MEAFTDTLPIACNGFTESVLFPKFTLGIIELFLKVTSPQKKRYLKIRLIHQVSFTLQLKYFVVIFELPTQIFLIFKT